MNKDIFNYIVVFTALFLIGFYSHNFIIISNKITLSFSLEKTYHFHAFFSALVCVNLRFFSKNEKVKPQLGFIYLGSLILKLVLFSVVFYNPLFTIDSFKNSEKISLLIPVLIFLFFEVIFTVKILNRK
ncbi:DUF6168 family protein [Polaribacter pectinis]|uniref:DUF6168 family protein n=1 Tax=Polaribacter pectinis TaxID=2738844 RepID=UPI001CA3A386